jgi:DNA modification methylase/transcriptional regulator with XRE-family HTH domain
VARKKGDLSFGSGRVLVGDCLKRLKDLPDDSVDSVVTDPPYELGFMGKKWDGSGIAYNVELWAECLRVLKPGGHLLAFGGTRTYHRMTVAIEDAGFEVRDSLHWLYGSGFPKSLDVSKAIDKRGGADIAWFGPWLREVRRKRGISSNELAKNFPSKTGGETGCVSNWELGLNLPTPEQFNKLCDVLGLDFDRIEAAEREVVGKTDATVLAVAPGEGRDRPPVELDITAPATDAARQWSGWGTALKPAHEPIVVARKPLVGTVAATVLAHGTGALNIDGCRVGSDGGGTQCNNRGDDGKCRGHDNAGRSTSGATVHGPDTSAGRWPANLVFTHAADCVQVSPGATDVTLAEEVSGGIWRESTGKPAGPTYDDTPAVWRCADGCPVAELDGQSGERPGAVGKTQHWSSGYGAFQPSAKSKGHMGTTDTGGASRFFTVTEWDPIADVAPFRYVAKPSKRERNAGLDGLPKVKGGSMNGAETRPGKPTNHPIRENFHPTVKPVALMRWLVRLVTPPGGTVLDPFAGSGTTLVAATLEGFEFVGCELTTDYLPIIKGRVKWAEKEAAKQAPTLFGDTA